MSIAEFYIEHGIDPSDPYHMEQVCEMCRGDNDDSYTFGDTPRAVIQRLERDSSSLTAESSWPLNESELDYMSETRGWERITGLPAQPPMASYRKDGVRLNFWLSTGTVGSYLDHPRQGKTQLFRRKISMSDASDIFNNPRRHTGKGYKTNNEPDPGSDTKKRKAGSPALYLRSCAQCGRSKPNEEYSKNQRRKGSSAKCKSCV